MPMYAYKCESCEQQFEIKQRMVDEPLRDCILCNDGQVRRVINNVGIVFKGNGFYVTDTRKQGNGVAKSPSNSSSTTKSESASTTDEKKSTSSESTSKSESTSPSTTT